MTRFFCSTNHCALQAAQLCHAAQTIAGLTAERDAARAEVARMRVELVTANKTGEFYQELFCAELARGESVR